ncbi:MAG: S1C family serine protease [Acidimicrobiales bacterium]
MAVATEDRGIQGDPGDERWDDADGEGMRGWIPPDDRLWRHPSESGPPPAGSSAPGSAPGRAGGRPRPVPWIAGGATACVLLALVATGLVIMTTGSSDQGRAGSRAEAAALTGEPTTEPGVGQMPDAAAIDGMVSIARPSLVALKIDAPGGTTVGTGIVTESGGIIVTASRLVSGAKTITVVEANGSVASAGVVGTDESSGLAVLRIADDLPAVSFDTDDPATDSVAVAMALEPGLRTASPPSVKVYAGSVASAGRTTGSQSTTDMFSASEVDAPLAGDDIGCPLLDAGGQVFGMLEGTKQAGGSTTADFLPAEVVLGVAQQLVSSGQVDHGWLGVEASDAGATDPVAHTATTVATTMPVDGARLDAVDGNSPAAAVGLHAGDVIIGIDGSPVHSKSELETRLYPDAPGTALDLRFVRDGTTMTASVVLADPRSDVPGSDSSP